MDWAAAGLTAQVFALAMAVTFFAGFVKGAIGFAMPMIMIAAFTAFLPPETALAGLIMPEGLAGSRHGKRPRPIGASSSRRWCSS